ncbi:MAG: hypothetical protein HY075_04245 [Deltaproteobacteria bacterium]|nr:hypothetical protein [Deltaproteobacteria bacterium]
MALSIPLLLAVLLTSACSYHRDKTGSEESGSTTRGATGTTLADSASLSYQLVRSRVLAPRCIGCHSAAHNNPGGVNLETYESTRSRLAAIQQVAVLKRSMPPRHPLSDEESVLLNAWINAGAPEQAAPQAASPAAQPASPEPTVPATHDGHSTDAPTTPPVAEFPSVRRLLLERHCISCHAARADALGIPRLETARDLRQHIDAVIDRVLVDRDMPPQSQAPLSDEELRVFIHWLKNGMKD